jgi:hypothetical protein
VLGGARDFEEAEFVEEEGIVSLEVSIKWELVVDEEDDDDEEAEAEEEAEEVGATPAPLILLSWYAIRSG